MDPTKPSTPSGKKPRAEIDLPELNIDVPRRFVRIGRASVTSANAREFAASIIKIADAVDTLSK